MDPICSKELVYVARYIKIKAREYEGWERSNVNHIIACDMTEPKVRPGH
jgi:hypothetical protein